MTIIRLVLAECSGCKDRQPAVMPRETHPPMWPAVTDASGTRHFCSHACLFETSGAERLPNRRDRLPFRISTTDVDTLNLVAQGLSNAEIAARMNLVQSTIKNRLSTLFQRMDAPSRIEAVLRAHSLGLINLNLAAEACAKRLMQRPPPGRAA